MDDQEALSRENGSPNNDPTGRLRRNVAEVAHDVTAMAELQTKLFLVDLKECRTRGIAGALLGVVALILFLGSVPVALAALGLLLSETAGWPLSAALGCVFGVGLLITLLLFWIAWRRLKSTFAALERSKEELQRNLEWFKTVLRNDPSPASRQRK